jgi:N-acetylgalactosamine kinase
MAIDLDTVVALRRGGGVLHLANVDSKRYPDVTFPIDPSQEVNVGKHNWGNYFLSGYKGVYEHLAAYKAGIPPPAPTGLQVMVHGRVPTGGGLSSSAAIVCSSALAVLAVNDVTLTKGEVAEFTARAERYVGVTSGGMDQAISIMGRPGIAQHVEFNPVRGTDVQLPEDACFVIANSLTVSNKAEGAEGRYNLRVVECRLASAMLAVLLGQARNKAVAEFKTLKDVEPLAEARFVGEKLGNASNAGVAAVRALLHEEAYDHVEIESIIGVPVSQVFEGDASAGRVLSKFSQFKLRQRAEHVFAEKQRVLEFSAVCADEKQPGDAQMAALAALMDASQASCCDLYECSSPELNTLVSLAKEVGALGSRLTGAGWGGCTVSLVKKEGAEEFITALTEKYYRPLIDAGRLREDELPCTIFASKPAAGGGILDFKI